MLSGLALLHEGSKAETVAAILHYPDLFDNIEKTPELCLTVVGQDGNFLRSVQSDTRTPKQRKRVMRTLQYLSEANVIKVWNDKIFYATTQEIDKMDTSDFKITGAEATVT